MKKLRVHLLVLCIITQVNLDAKKTTVPPVLSTQDIQEKFLEYFVSKHYIEVDPVSVVSDNGTVVTSGLTPFRDILLGKEERPADKIVSIQPCIRARAPYNDHDKVLSSAQHLTSFDSASFFSFDNPSSKKTIPLVHNFLTKELKLDPKMLFVTVHKDDREALATWKKLIPKKRIFHLDDKDNWWQEQGVAPAVGGYSTEVFYDKRPQAQRKKLPTPNDFRNGTMTELVNIVSHTATIKAPPSFSPSPWMNFSGKSLGFQRMAAVVQNVPSVYETDEIKSIMQQVEKSVGKTYAQADEQTRAHMRVICDHMRTVPLLINNGVKPSDRTPAGETLKDLLERAQISANIVAPKKKNVLPEVAQVALQQLAPIHPQIRKNKAKILKIIGDETDSKK